MMYRFGSDKTKAVYASFGYPYFLFGLCLSKGTGRGCRDASLFVGPVRLGYIY